MKKCGMCNEGLPLRDFNKSSGNPDGYQNRCRKCSNAQTILYKRSVKGLISKIYSNQKLAVKRDKYDKTLEYSKAELTIWMLRQENFTSLYNGWVESGYDRMMVPSVDRLDDYKGYTLTNIRLVTWKVNDDKAQSDRRNGINNKASISVTKMDAEGKVIQKYPSLHMAARENNCHYQNIRACCAGKRNTCGGFKWKYDE